MRCVEASQPLCVYGGACQYSPRSSQGRSRCTRASHCASFQGGPRWRDRKVLTFVIHRVEIIQNILFKFYVFIYIFLYLYMSCEPILDFQANMLCVLLARYIRQKAPTETVEELLPPNLLALEILQKAGVHLRLPILPSSTRIILTQPLALTTRRRGVDVRGGLRCT